MANSHNSLVQNHLNRWRLLPYAVFGIVAFSLTSASSLHILLKSYLIILEIPLGLLGILMIPKWVRREHVTFAKKVGRDCLD